MEAGWIKARFIKEEFMGIIGIAVNPDSGKDIRRLVSHATVFDNNEKTNIIERVILTINQLGKHDIYLMPDRYNFASRLLKKPCFQIENEVPFQILDMETTHSADDTVEFVRRMNTLEADALVILGGDGTSRAAAKTIENIPMIPVSTGTNNVFPKMAEGTVVGMAAAALASKVADFHDCLEPTKRIEIYKENKLMDIALVDAVVTKHTFSGSKAVWDIDSITDVIVTKCHPASIGFSALLGTSIILENDDQEGAIAHISKYKADRKVPFAAAVIESVKVSELTLISEDKPLTMIMPYSGMIALDGEREISFKEGETFQFCIKRNGPKKANLKKVLKKAWENGFFQVEGMHV